MADKHVPFILSNKMSNGDNVEWKTQENVIIKIEKMYFIGPLKMGFWNHEKKIVQEENLIFFFIALNSC